LMGGWDDLIVGSTAIKIERAVSLGERWVGIEATKTLP